MGFDIKLVYDACGEREGRRGEEEGGRGRLND